MILNQIPSFVNLTVADNSNQWRQRSTYTMLACLLLPNRVLCASSGKVFQLINIIALTTFQMSIFYEKKNPSLFYIYDCTFAIYFFKLSTSKVKPFATLWILAGSFWAFIKREQNPNKKTTNRKHTKSYACVILNIWIIIVI